MVTRFTHHLAYLNKGMLNDELSERLAEVVKAVRDTNKTGQIQLTLKISKLSADEDEDNIVIAPAINTKIPEPEQPKQVMQSTYDGDLIELQED